MARQRGIDRMHQLMRINEIAAGDKAPHPSTNASGGGRISAGCTLGNRPERDKAQMSVAPVRSISSTMASIAVRLQPITPIVE